MTPGSIPQIVQQILPDETSNGGGDAQDDGLWHDATYFAGDDGLWHDAAYFVEDDGLWHDTAYF